MPERNWLSFYSAHLLEKHRLTREGNADKCEPEEEREREREREWITIHARNHSDLVDVCILVCVSSTFWYLQLYSVIHNTYTWTTYVCMYVCMNECISSSGLYLHMHWFLKLDILYSYVQKGLVSYIIIHIIDLECSFLQCININSHMLEKVAKRHDK